MNEVSNLGIIWSIITAILGAYGSAAVLFYRMSAAEKRMDAHEADVKEWREEMKLAIQTSSKKADDDLQKYMEMERQEHIMIISSLEKSIDRVSEKIDKLMDYNLEQANRRRASDSH